MFPTLAPETPTFMGLPEAKTPEDLKGVDAAIIGAPYVATTHDTYAGVDRNEWLSAPKRVRQQSARLPIGIYPGVPNGRVRPLESSRLRRRPHPRRGYERPVPRKHSKGPGCRRDEGGTGSGRRRNSGGYRAELPVRVLCHRQADSRADGWGRGLCQPRHSLGHPADRLPVPGPENRRLRELEAQDVRVPRKHAPSAPGRDRGAGDAGEKGPG